MNVVRTLTLLAGAGALLPGSTEARVQTGTTSAPSPAGSCQPKGWRDPQPKYESVEVLPDRRVTFRLCAPQARDVRVVSPDLRDLVPAGSVEGATNGLAMIRDATGLWTATTGTSVLPDVYRFNFHVDGVPVPDPRGSAFSQQRNGLISTFEVAGPTADFHAFRPGVAHGVVSKLEYWSKSLGIRRRAHLYTPPGYNRNARRYPVLYLVHGAGDSDESWTSIGHANYILDNLIAAGKATPMIVVMPEGHTPERSGQSMLRNDDFGRDLTDDLIPLIDRSFRTVAAPESRAMAGLSMGGAHTLNIGLTHPDLFNAVGVFSIGLGMVDSEGEIATYERTHAEALRRTAREMKLVYYAIGKDDFLYESVAPTRAMLDRAKIRYTYVESSGGHEWANWRRYFLDLAPLLFK